MNMQTDYILLDFKPQSPSLRSFECAQSFVVTKIAVKNHQLYTKKLETATKIYVKILLRMRKFRHAHAHARISNPCQCVSVRVRRVAELVIPNANNCIWDNGQTHMGVLPDKCTVRKWLCSRFFPDITVRLQIMKRYLTESSDILWRIVYVSFIFGQWEKMWKISLVFRSFFYVFNVSFRRNFHRLNHIFIESYNDC